MKITNKNLLLFFTVFILIIAGLICVIIFYTPDPQSDVIVSSQRPASFDPVKSTQFDATPVEIASPASTVTETSPAMNIATATPIPSDQWEQKIQDPLGDPITAGTIAFGSDTLSFTNGSVIIPASAPHELKVKVSADGYAPGEFTITPNSSPLVLDYLCNFFIRVVDEKGAPAPNALIRIWKSNPPPRPIKDQATVYTNKGYPFRLMRNEQSCRVIWADKPSSKQDTIVSIRGEAYPKIGDLIMSLGACAWQAGYASLHIRKGSYPQISGIFPLADGRSCRLRIWDSLSMAELSDSNQVHFLSFPQILEILRDDQVLLYYQYFPLFPENQPPLLEEKTNERGEWKLCNVPPALYYVQAFNGENCSSSIVTLYPASGGALLRLWGEGQLMVYVEKEGIHSKDKQFLRVPNAEIILQSQTGIKAYSEKSDDAGMARFLKLIPYGDYRLIVKAPGQTVEKNVTINKPVNTCLVKLPHEEFYKITGIVQMQDSGTPVAGYALELNTNMGPGDYGYHVYQETITDVNGRFEFHDVMPGKFNISENIKSLGELKYIFSEPSVGYHYLFESYNQLSNISLDVHENIHDLKILVKPLIKTNFSGCVVDLKGIPAANAVFSIDFGMDKMHLYPEDFKTDASGLFSLTIFNTDPSVGIRRNFEITAMTGSMGSPWVLIDEKKERYRLTKDNFLATSIGSVTVEGELGDTFKNLRITLEPKISDKTLQGRLVAEGENNYSEVNITATQKTRSVIFLQNEEGYFKAGNISAGDMTLTITPCIHSSIYTPNGLRKYNKYINRTVKIRIEDDQPETYVEIPLQRAGYYWGYVKDNNGKPLPDIAVWAEDKPNRDHMIAETDQNGFFLIDWISLMEGKRYNIKYDVGGQEKIMPAVPLNTGNMLLQ